MPERSVIYVSMTPVSRVRSRTGVLASCPLVELSALLLDRPDEVGPNGRQRL
jgi:hypothetical protein